MERKLKILKAVLLLRKINRYQSKEEQTAMADKHYSDKEIDEWIEFLRNLKDTPEEECEPDPTGLYEEDNRYPSCTTHDYSPSHPWDAPGMSIRDFI